MENAPEFRILIVDDNPAIHSDITKVLASVKGENDQMDSLESKLFEKSDVEIEVPSFKIATASQGQEGIALVSDSVKAKDPFALAFVDIRMPPGLDGIQTIEKMWEIDKRIQVVICTAYSDYTWEQTVARLGMSDNFLILKKPFDNVAVRQLVSALTKKWYLMQQAEKYMHSLEAKVKSRTEELQESLSLVKATLDSTTDGVLVVDAQGKIVDYNQKFVGIWGIPENILKEKSDQKAMDFAVDQLESPLEFISKVKSLYSQPEAVSVDVLKFKDGRIVERYSQPQKLEGKTIGRVWSFRDVTERTNLERELEYQATHDALTGLPNRALLMDRVQQAIASAERNRKKFALLFFDLDRFKIVNDSFSHMYGDKLLREVAKRLNYSTRAGDTFARLGGDEFVLVVNDLKDEKAAMAVAQKILKEIAAPFLIDEREIVVTVSIGISLFPKDGKSSDVLLRSADLAMYRAKEMGKNNFQFYTSDMNIESIKQLDMENQLRGAIKNQEFFLQYQPQFNLFTGKLEAAEALIRWNHPKRGVVYPIDFISYAEESGLILPIGDWVLESVCDQHLAWVKMGLSPIRIAVNAAGQQFRLQDFPKKIEEILKKKGVEPEYLEIELTENMIISNEKTITDVMRLKEMGVKIALDDFGTGYSSLSYLKKLPLDRLKIDRTFIQSIHQAGKNDESIIKAIISMASSLNLKVIAEGVESKDQISFLKNEACEEVQGFYFSKPLSVESFEILLKKQPLSE